MFNEVKMVINEHWNDDDDAGHDVVQKVQEGSGEVGLILQVTGSGASWTTDPYLPRPCHLPI